MITHLVAYRRLQIKQFYVSGKNLEHWLGQKTCTSDRQLTSSRSQHSSALPPLGFHQLQGTAEPPQLLGNVTE